MSAWMGRGESGAGGTARIAAERVLRLTALIWCGLWMVSIAWMLLDNPSLTTVPVFAWACLLALLASWVGLLMRTASGAAFVGVGSITALVQVASVNVSGSAAYFMLAATWSSLATVGAALLLQRQHAVPVILGVTALTVLILILVGIRTGQWPGFWRDIVDVAIYALVDGMAVAVASRELRAAADIADTEGTRLASFRRSESARLARRAAIQDVHRVVHDTFVNTLGAIRAGAGVRSSQAVRSRCQFDLSCVRAVRSGQTSQSVAEAADWARVVGAGLGLHVDLEYSPEPRSTVSAAVYRALTGIIQEALVNVSKHSGCDRAKVRIHLDEKALSADIEDAGRGWSGAFTPAGGISESIIERAVSTGGSAQIVTSRHGGTRVEVRWPYGSFAEPAPLPDEASESGGGDSAVQPWIPAALRRTYAEAAAWLMVLVVVQWLLHAEYTEGKHGILAVAIVGISVPVILRGPWSLPPLPLWATVMLATLMVPVALLPAWNAAGCPAVGPGSWGLDAALVIALAMCLLGGSMAPVFAATAALSIAVAVPLATGTVPFAVCGAESLVVLLIESGAMVAVFLFRRLLVRLLSQANRDRTLAADLQDARAADLARELSRDARFAVVLTTVEPFLAGLADGRLDPTDPEVRTEAGAKETALRSLLALGPELDRLGHVLAECLLNAAATGRSVDIRCADPVPDPEPATLKGIGEVLELAVAATPPGGVVSVGLLSAGATCSMTLVLPTARSLYDETALGLLREQGLTVNCAALEGETLVEVRWGAPGHRASVAATSPTTSL